MKVTVRCYNSLLGMFFRTGEHTWLFTEPDLGMEVPLPCSNSQTHRPFLQSAISGKSCYNWSEDISDTRSWIMIVKTYITLLLKPTGQFVFCVKDYGVTDEI